MLPTGVTLSYGLTPMWNVRTSTERQRGGEETCRGDTREATGHGRLYVLGKQLRAAEGRGEGQEKWVLRKTRVLVSTGRYTQLRSGGQHIESQ